MISVQEGLPVHDNPSFVSCVSLRQMSFCCNDLDDALYVLLAQFFGVRFDHDADDRLGSGLANQDSAGVAQFIGNLIYSCL